ncbi:NAD(P)-binding protein [Fluviispira multicolorata]|uniref:NAD(P)-binding protein n=1 Tax=Fluviispira multicolorata TaxID=2654512 RepID=A0A833N7H8_9BACT|nr:FAD/NAD(P)-binding protein [Fluviispira multicolorata]KAB8032185.1 NAD(P)-binding protein [Fluviispira multicolorata]
MSSTQESNKNNFDIAIVGGGLSGILLALRLSRDKEKFNEKIVLIEQQPQLGGRNFFSSPLSFSGKSHSKINQEILFHSSHSQHLSGPGFEFMNVESLNAMLRHLQSHLTDEESVQFEEYINRIDELESERRNRCFFIKKEFVTDSEILSGSSEILTKREAELLRSFVFDFYSPIQNSYEENTERNNIPFEKSSQWNELSKASKETLSALFSSIIGPEWEKSTFIYVCKCLWTFFNAYKEPLPKFFKRKIALELFIENILRGRGIEVRTLCEVLRVNHNKETSFNLILADEVNPSHKTILCEKLVFAIPLVQCLGIIAKENFSPEQSRFVSRVRPLSLVVSEISDFLSVRSEHWPDNVGACDRLLFPVERVQGFLTSDGRLLFSTQLDYEDSLQAPAVREAVARLRRAVARVVKPEIAEEIKRGARIPQNKVTERIVLLPVAQSIPNNIPVNIEVKETKMGIKGLYCCGDSFPTLADEPWKRVIASVQDVVMRLHGNEI